MLAAYVRELVKLVPGTGYVTSLFLVQDQLDELLRSSDLRATASYSTTTPPAALILNRALQLYGSGDPTIRSLHDPPMLPV